MPPDANNVILLYSVTLTPTSVVSDACLTVQVAIPPTNAAYTTPILIGCDPPDPPVWPAQGTEFIMNPVTRQCTVGVGRTTWSGLKVLYME